MTVEHHTESDDLGPQESNDEASQVAAPKKPFVEPAISHPVDVLEATTYFQTVDSGGTGLRPSD